ncbi:MAG: hypothetical protein Alpg2KO_11830 [Alphaproteobacteria bacterium]
MRLAIGGNHGARCLTGDFASLKHKSFFAEFNFNFMVIEHFSSTFTNRSDDPAPCQIYPGMRAPSSCPGAPLRLSRIRYVMSGPRPLLSAPMANRRELLTGQRLADGCDA